MKLTLTTALSVLMLSAPAFEETSSAPGAPVSKDAKTDFTKPFIYDGLKRQAPPNHVDSPSVELRVGPRAKDLTADKSPVPGSAHPQR